MRTKEVQDIIPQDFSDNARVWIYQGNRPFSEKEEMEINEQLLQFYSQWLSHGDTVKGWAKLLFRQFVVVMADEEATGVSGCSTDSSVRVIKSLESQYSVNFFDRMTITFLVKERAEMLPYNQVQYALDKGYINEDTPFFNNVVSNKKDLLNSWLVPLKSSWLADRLSLPSKN